MAPPKSHVMKGSYRRIGREFLSNFAGALREVVAAPSQVPPRSTEHDNDPFQYTPLASPSGFRILHLKRGYQEHSLEDKDIRLCGSLVEASIDAPPEYYALSYTWGNPALCETIDIDGKQLRITASCAAALRRMLRGKMQRTIWVDSICINQGDTPEALNERGRQVAMMGDIYRKAVQVNVHLGEGDPASDVACVALKQLANCYIAARVPGPQQGRLRRKYDNLADDVLAATPEYPYGKLHGVFRLPWFRPIWVVQEVVLGRNVVFYCGKHMIHLKVLVAGADFSRLPYSRLDSNVANRHWMSYLEYHDAMNEFLRRKELGEQLSIPGLTVLGVLLVPALTLEATRPEDKIHGLYNVCKGLGFELPAPDYHKPVAAVYTEAAQAIIRFDQSLELLTHVIESSAWEWGLPSWVPNFSGCFRKWSPSNPPHITIPGKANPAVSGGTKWEYEFMPDPQALRVKGRRVDMVCASGLPWMLDSSTNMLGDSPIQTGQVIPSFLDSMISWLGVVTVLQGQGYDRDTKAAMTLLARTLLHASPKPVHLSAGDLESVVRDLCSMLLTSARSHGEPCQTAVAGPQDNPQECLRVGDYLVAPRVRDFAARMVVHHWKTVFRTVGGYLGLGTHTVQDGDIVVVFYGNSLPAVLRPRGDSYRYVGAAVVGDIMSGEFWGTGSPADDEWFVLV